MNHGSIIIGILSAHFLVFLIYNLVPTGQIWTHSISTFEELGTTPRDARPTAGFPNTESSGENCPDADTAQLADITPEQISNCDQKSPLLWSYIRQHHVTAPSKLPYSFPANQGMSESLPPLWPILQEMTKGKRDKIFVEAGANDGFNYSHTIWLEETQGWSGILIECNPELRTKLLGQNRKAWVVDTCLSSTNRPTTETLTSAVGEIGYPPSLLGSLLPNMSRFFPPEVSPTSFQVQTMPLFAILAALKVRVVDFFVLDVQSLELYVLQTFPFDLVHVKMWMIEVNALSGKDRMALVILMRSKGYIVSNILERPIRSIGYKVRVPNQDLVFISKRLD